MRLSEKFRKYATEGSETKFRSMYNVLRQGRIGLESGGRVEEVDRQVVQSPATSAAHSI
jgi:hypothetical protein